MKIIIFLMIATPAVIASPLSFKENKVPYFEQQQYNAGQQAKQQQLPYWAEQQQYYPMAEQQQYYPRAEQQQYYPWAEQQQYYPRAEQQQLPYWAEEQQYSYGPFVEQQMKAQKKMHRQMFGQEKDGLSLALEQAGCYNLQIPTGIAGSLTVEICPDTNDGCGHVLVELGSTVHTEVDICDNGNQQCVIHDSFNDCGHSFPLISLPVYVRDTAVHIELSIFPSLSVCIRSDLPSC